MKRILVFGAGKSSSHLIAYLLEHAEKENWQVTLADANYEAAAGKINNHARGNAIGLDIQDAEQRRQQIGEADIVVSMLPAFLHIKVAEDCIAAGKNLLTASYVDDAIKALAPEVEEKGLLFLCEIGLDPGIDHMSAMEMLDEIRGNGGTVTGFRSHCGGLVAPESDDNPWHYKISWNPRNIILAGKAGAHYRENGKEVELSYNELFDASRTVNVPGLGNLSWYPNRDSLRYESLYGLNNTPGFVRTTLRHPDFMKGWKKLVDLQLTQEKPLYDSTNQSAADVLKKHFEHYQLSPDSIDTGFKSQWDYLNLDDANRKINRESCTPADLLQLVCEDRLGLNPSDRDMVVMLHEVDYVVNNTPKSWKASLVVIGEDSVHTAMSKTVGTPLAIACRLILTGRINATGVRIPVIKEIYEPVLEELAKYGIAFQHEKNGK